MSSTSSSGAIPAFSLKHFEKEKKLNFQTCVGSELFEFRSNPSGMDSVIASEQFEGLRFKIIHFKTF